MRQARIKVAADEADAVYHVMSRVVNGERVIDRVGREVLRAQLWQVADFAGLEIITYAILSNHFHILVRVPRRTPLDDDELLRRYRVLYPRPTRYQTARLDVIVRQLATNGAEAVAWRSRQLALMSDVSQYMKLLKQRFSIWHNKTHERYGTLWAERFKSVLVEPKGRAIEAIAAYIDLNCVRAGLASDPKDYRFCGYAEAVAGGENARRGIQSVLGHASWDQTQGAYRQILFGAGGGARERGRELLIKDVKRVLEDGGQLPLAEVLRCRVRYFSDGLVLGAKAFVEAHLARDPQKPDQRKVHPLPGITDWGELAAIRRLRRNAFS